MEFDRCAMYSTVYIQKTDDIIRNVSKVTEMCMHSQEPLKLKCICLDYFNASVQLFHLIKFCDILDPMCVYMAEHHLALFTILY